MKRFLFLSLTINWIYASKVNSIPSSTHFQKREVQTKCRIPTPLEHGQYRVSPQTCPPGDRRATCQLVPGTIAPDLWVLYYSCLGDFELSSIHRASVCRGGQWLPPLPVCVTKLKLMKRAEWGSTGDNSAFRPQNLPLTRVIIAHTATGQCNSRTNCILSTQSIQQHHIPLYGDIGYNFLVGGDGSVMEGQGWDKIGAHTINYNTGSVCIAMIGNYVDSEPQDRMLMSVRKLIERGVAMGKLSPNYKLYAHCQLIQIASPGQKVFDEISNWPNWDPLNALRCTN